MLPHHHGLGAVLMKIKCVCALFEYQGLLLQHLSVAFRELLPSSVCTNGTSSCTHLCFNFFKVVTLRYKFILN